MVRSIGSSLVDGPSTDVIGGRRLTSVHTSRFLSRFQVLSRPLRLLDMGISEQITPVSWPAKAKPDSMFPRHYRSSFIGSKPYSAAQRLDRQRQQSVRFS